MKEGVFFSDYGLSAIKIKKLWHYKKRFPVTFY